MDETVNEIEAQIDRTRDRLGSNLRELEHKVDTATDWREHFRERPHVFIGAAFVGGVMLAGALRRTSATGEGGRVHARHVGTGSAQAQAMELWNHIQGALIGVASARITQFMAELVPGFDEHYRRAEQRASAVQPFGTSG